MSIRESRFGRLVSHFFAGFLDNDLLMSSEAGMQGALAQIIALVAAPGLFYCLFACFGPIPERDAMTWPDKLLFVGVTMVVTGFLTVIEWDALFPDQRDYQILGPLPLTPRLIFVAKVSSVLLLLAIFWAAANLAPTVLFPAAVTRTTADFLRSVTAHAVATFSASAFVFLFLIGLQGILLNALPTRSFRRVSLYVQLAAVLVLVFSFMWMPQLLSSSIQWVRTDSRWLYVLPPFWFFGIYQVIVGRGEAVFSSLAEIGIEAIGAAVVVAAVAYLVSYQRHMRKSLESVDAGRCGPGLLARAAASVVDRFALRHPLERACFHFVHATLARSRVHRLLLAAYAGIGFALVLGSVALMLVHGSGHQPTPVLLSVQLVLSFFLLSGMRFAFTVPGELRANWLFQASEPAEAERCCAGVRRAMLALAVLPVSIGLSPFHVFLWGWEVAMLHLVYGGLLSVLLMELLLLRFSKIPFTCTYLPGKANVKGLWPVYLSAFWLYAYVMGELEFRLLAHPLRFAVAILAGILLVAGLRRYRKSQLGSGFRFVFQDLPEPAVRTLDIGSLAADPRAKTHGGSAMLA